MRNPSRISEGCPSVGPFVEAIAAGVEPATIGINESPCSASELRDHKIRMADLCPALILLSVVVSFSHSIQVSYIVTSYSHASPHFSFVMSSAFSTITAGAKSPKSSVSNTVSMQSCKFSNSLTCPSLHEPLALQINTFTNSPAFLRYRYECKSASIVFDSSSIASSAAAFSVQSPKAAIRQAHALG